ncbi:hypothetical protein Taro_014741 [Colocasia esculenta]|uniref:Uncharacterized protein n=1 Tax=Colocasia esculenta TaxID=4460 RepID=A0A843UK11_COLES|nr:hypothetical protein [Colocasia esculenta]
MTPCPLAFLSSDRAFLTSYSHPLITTMRAFCLLLISLLIVIAFQLSPPDQYSLTRPLSFVPAANLTPRQSLGRKLMAAPSLVSPELDAAPARNLKKEGDGRMERAGEMGDPASDGVENNGFIYEVDYHGVTTHPSSRPKHPKVP